MNVSNRNNKYVEEMPLKEPKKGAWRKDFARYEEDLELLKLRKETQKKINSLGDLKDEDVKSKLQKTKQSEKLQESQKHSIRLVEDRQKDIVTSKLIFQPNIDKDDHFSKPENRKPEQSLPEKVNETPVSRASKYARVQIVGSA